MKRLIIIIACVLMQTALSAQTLNVTTGQVTYQMPSSQTGEMVFNNGTTVTIMDKTFTLADVEKMYVDNSDVTDGTVSMISDRIFLYMPPGVESGEIARVATSVRIR